MRSANSREIIVASGSDIYLVHPVLTGTEEGEDASVVPDHAEAHVSKPMELKHAPLVSRLHLHLSKGEVEAEIQSLCVRGGPLAQDGKYMLAAADSRGKGTVCVLSDLDKMGAHGEVVEGELDNDGGDQKTATEALRRKRRRVESGSSAERRSLSSWTMEFTERSERG